MPSVGSVCGAVALRGEEENAGTVIVRNTVGELVKSSRSTADFEQSRRKLMKIRQRLE